MKQTEELLKVRDLTVRFRVRRKKLTAIRNVSLTVYEDEVLAIVGESGSGKTVLTRVFSGLLADNGEIVSGQVFLRGKSLTYAELNGLCGRLISFVFQEPAAALDPVIKVGDQIAAAIRKHERCSKKTAKEKAVGLMTRVGIRDADLRYDDYPFQYSGGMLQRIVIAIAIACKPQILICDEATTSLDVTIQMQILELLRSLQKEMHFALLMITHDLGIAANIADRVAVMYAGEIVETGTVDEIFYDPRHPYTWALLASMPQLARPGGSFYYLPGTQPPLGKEIQGDSFAPRNAWRMKIDTLADPPVFQISETHFAKTWLLDSRAPSVQKPENVAEIHQTLLQTFQSSPEIACQTEKKTLLEIDGVSIGYTHGKQKVRAVRNVSLQIREGEILALVGESGSGKTTLGKAVAGFLPVQEGKIRFQERCISGKLTANERKEIHRMIQMVFQNQTLSLNDRMSVRQIIAEGLDNYPICRNNAEKESRIEDMMQSVGLLPDQLNRYPHELSGGQRQRIGIARALILQPRLVVADEPVASLDVSVRAQVLNLIRKICKEKGTSFLFNSHDLSVVRLIADRTAVMKKGVIVELAGTDELFRFPMHPYTRSLLSAIPLPDPRIERNRTYMEYREEKEEKESFLQDIGHQHVVLCTIEEKEKYGQIREKEDTGNPLWIALNAEKEKKDE